jgi:putative acyl-CoA dehydrogenase
MTHEVFNQPPPLEGHNTFTLDVALAEALAREGAGSTRSELEELGSLAGTPEAIEWGRLANENPPVLHTHDRSGHRIDRVEYHPAYHRLMATAVGHGLHATPWHEVRPGGHVARAAKMVTWSPVDAGHTCPISMTYAVVATLRHSPELAAQWEPRLASRTYDPAYAPAGRKKGLTAGMAMTEKQGGSDVRANTTTAEPAGDGSFRLSGHKWFVSAPMSDIFLTLAVAPGGLTCFMLPRWLPDETRNDFAIQRLKDKMGDRSNASSEVEFDGAIAWMVGEEGDGVRTIIEMVNRTRLDCALGAAAGMRHGLIQAMYHCRHREAFGKLLTEQPVMARVLADLAIESEAATAASMRLAGAYDRNEQFARIATPVIKYWVCKRNPGHAAEALECLGGAGYVEESPLPRIFRQSPLNGVWEGSGNVICLDVLRAMERSSESIEAFREPLAAAAGTYRAYDEALRTLDEDLAGGVDPWDARRVVERMAVLLQAALLILDAPGFVADAFVAGRIGDPGVAYGALPDGVDVDAILERALPA